MPKDAGSHEPLSINLSTYYWYADAHHSAPAYTGNSVDTSGLIKVRMS